MSVDTYYIVQEAAQIAHMSVSRILALFAAGRVHGAFRTDGTRGNWRVSDTDLRAWMLLRISNNG